MTTFGFNKKNAQRIATAVKQVESMNQNKLTTARTKPVVGGSGGTKLVRIVNAYSTTGMTAYNAEICSIEVDGSNREAVGTDNFLYVVSIRGAILIDDTLYLAHKVGGDWLIDNQAIFVEEM